MELRRVWVFLLVLWVASLCTDASRKKRQEESDVGVLRLAAFNIQIFGVTKYGKPDVVEILSRIVQRYDITLIQEIRDASQTVIHNFLNKVNMDAAADGVTFDLIVSDRLGRTNSKEQYAYLYRVDTVNLTQPYLYNDSVADLFEREPYAVRVESLLLDLPPFFLLGLHSAPNHVMQELNALDDVFNLTVEFYGTQNGIILGDLNADCNFLSQTRYNQLDLVLDQRFTWLIGNSVDTTTSASVCAYDRFIVAGDIGTYIVADSAQVFLYDMAYQLNETFTIDVSDHYPIECHIQGNLLLTQTQSPDITRGQSTTDSSLSTMPSLASTLLSSVIVIAVTLLTAQCCVTPLTTLT